MFAYCGNNPINKIDGTGTIGLAIGIFIGGSAIFGGLAGAFTAAVTSGNVLEGIVEGAFLGAAAATATIFVPPLVVATLPATMATSTVSMIASAATFVVSGVAGMVIDYAVQATSYVLNSSFHDDFELDVPRFLKSGLLTGIAGIVPTYGEPQASVINAIGSLFIGFDATFINAAIEAFIAMVFQ